MSLKPKQILQRFFRTEGDALFGDIFRGSVVTLISRVANAIVQLAVNLIIARSFSASMVGLLAMINSTVSITSIFTLIGTNTSVLRLLPETATKHSPQAAFHVQQRIHRLVLFLSPVVSLITIGAAYVYQWMSPQGSDRLPVFFLAAAILPFYSLGRLSTETLRAQQKTNLYALALLLPSLTNLVILSGLMLALPLPYAPVLALISSVLLVFFLVRWMAFSRSPKTLLQPEGIPGYAQIVRLSLPMGFTLAMQMVMSNFDLLMIGLVRSQSEAGVYNIASKLSILTSFIITSVNAVSAARFSQLYYSNQLPELLSLAKKSSRLMFWASLPILIILVVFGQFILGLFGKEFVTGYAVMLLMMSGEFINAVTGSVGLYLNMTGSHTVYRNIVSIAALANVVLNVLLVPRLGIIGSGISSLISVSIVNVSASVIVYKQTGTSISYIPTFIRNRIGQ